MDTKYIRELARELLSATSVAEVEAVIVELHEQLACLKKDVAKGDDPSLFPPNKGKTVAEFAVGKETYRLQLVKCGKKDCRCVRGACHGPYWYAFWRSRGKLKSRYLGKKLPDHLRAPSVRLEALPDLPAPAGFARPSVTDLAGSLDGWAEPTSAGAGAAES